MSDLQSSIVLSILVMFLRPFAFKDVIMTIVMVKRKTQLSIDARLFIPSALLAPFCPSF